MAGWMGNQSSNHGVVNQTRCGSVGHVTTEISEGILPGRQSMNIAGSSATMADVYQTVSAFLLISEAA